MSASEPFLVRQQHVQTLKQFSRALAEAFSSSTDETKQALSTALTGECIQCHFVVTGKEFLSVESADPKDTDNKLTRLQQGYCARKGCDSYFYRLKFFQHPGIDWEKILPQLESHQQKQDEHIEAEQLVIEEGKRAERNRLLTRLGFGVAALLVVFIMRQLYFGGRIPIIREPEKFRVDQYTNLDETVGD